MGVSPSTGANVIENCSLLKSEIVYSFFSGDFFFKKPKSIESSHVGCQTSASDFLDSEVQTDSPSLQPAETESGETKLLFDHVRTQNDMILKFCNDYSSLMPPVSFTWKISCFIPIQVPAKGRDPQLSFV